MKTQNQQTGLLGEDFALEYLLREGFLLQEKNWRYRKSEVDLILKEEESLVFVEVKTLRSDVHGTPESKISSRKLQLLWDAAGAYMDQSGFNGEIRFDFISVIIRSPSSYNIKHIRDAYWPQD